jgi:hypothetical protein
VPPDVAAGGAGRSDGDAGFDGDGLIASKLTGDDERLAVIGLNGKIRVLDEQEQG